MLRSIQQFFEQNMSLDASDSDSANNDVEHQLQLATAALLIETTRADFQTQDTEELAVVDSLLTFFQLSEEEIDTLKTLAKAEADEHVSLHQFTGLINQHYSPERKIELIEMMWRVSFADGHDDAHESHLIRKVASLLYVPHSGFIAAKMRAKQYQQSS